MGRRAVRVEEVGGAVFGACGLPVRRRRPARSGIAGVRLGARSPAHCSFEGQLGREGHVGGPGSAGVAMTVSPEDTGDRFRSSTPGGGGLIHRPPLCGTLEVGQAGSHSLPNRPLQQPTPGTGARPSRGSAFRVRATCAIIAVPAVAAERPNVGLHNKREAKNDNHGTTEEVRKKRCS